MISLSIVSHGQRHLAAKLLADIARLIEDPVEVLLTLNIPEAAPDGLGRFPFPVQLIENRERKGFGANHNAAFARSKGELFCVLNPDLRFSSDPFPALRRCLESDPSIAVCAPVVRSPTGQIEDSARRFPTPLSILRKAVLGTEGEPVDPGGTRPDWVAGMFMLCRRAPFEELRGFDERYFLYYEDVDLCARLRGHDYDIAVCAEAVVTHDAQRTSRRNLTYLRWHLGSMLRFFLSRAFRTRPRQPAHRER